MFSGSVNPITGKQEWVPQDRDVTSEEADISHELARSQYGDMLHDRERNHLYYVALERAIADVKASGCEAHVLDIGTGTGLLALMAARAGATRVTACEVLRPMVRIARQVIARNGFSDIIRIVAKRSTEMTEEEMGARANILVTEVFDTELIGEGALITFAHAHKHLLEAGCIVIPSLSNMYIRLIDSDFLWSAHKLIPSRFPRGIEVPASWENCAGPPSVWDLHVEEIKVPEQMKLLSDSVEIMQFPFSDPNLPTSHFTSGPTPVAVLESGSCHGVVVWWDIDLGGNTLTMNPWNYQQWRDHWLQAVFLLPRPVTVTKGEELNLTFRHDDYSIWFGVEQTTDSPSSLLDVERPLCTCDVHTACSRTRVGLYNDEARSLLFLSALKKVLVGKSVVCCISDGSLLPLQIARARDQFPSLKKVYSVESSHHCRRLINELVKANGLSNTVSILDKPCSELTSQDFSSHSADDCKIDAVIGEPYFSSSLLPWHNLHYWYAVYALRNLVSTDCVIMPGVVHLKAIAVNFENMYKLRAPVGSVEGFDISEFDRAVGKYTTTLEGIEAEPHHMWEYPGYPRSEVVTLMTFDLSRPIPEKTKLRESGEIELFQDSAPCHGVVLWMEYLLTADHVVSTGLLKGPGSHRSKLVWDPNHKQAVYFLLPKYTTQSLVKLSYSVCFSTIHGEMDLQFTGVH